MVADIHGHRRQLQAFLVVFQVSLLTRVWGIAGSVGAARSNSLPQTGLSSGDVFHKRGLHVELVPERGCTLIMVAWRLDPFDNPSAVAELGPNFTRLEGVGSRCLGRNSAIEDSCNFGFALHYVTTGGYVVGKNLSPICPILGVLGQHPSEEFLQKGADFDLIGYFEFIFVQDLNELADGTRLEGTEPENHSVEHHSQRPNICLHGVGLTLEHLGGHVDGRPQHGLGHAVLVFEGLAEAEIGNLQNPVVDEYIFGLDVPVHDVVFGQDSEGVGELPKINQALLLPESSGFFQNLLEGAAVAVLIDEIKIVDGLEHVQITNDVGAGPQRTQGVDLVDGAFLELGHLLKLVSLDHLDGHFLLGYDVDGLVDAGVVARAKLQLQRVVLYLLPHAMHFYYILTRWQKLILTHSYNRSLLTTLLKDYQLILVVRYNQEDGASGQIWVLDPPEPKPKKQKHNHSSSTFKVLFLLPSQKLKLNSSLFRFASNGSEWSQLQSTLWALSPMLVDTFRTTMLGLFNQSHCLSLMRSLTLVGFFLLLSSDSYISALTYTSDFFLLPLLFSGLSSFLRAYFNRWTVFYLVEALELLHMCAAGLLLPILHTLEYYLQVQASLLGGFDSFQTHLLMENGATRWPLSASAASSTESTSSN